MAISGQDKKKIIGHLQRTKQKANDLELSLLFEGKTDEANEVAEKAKDLSKQIDVLLGQAMAEWQGQGQAVIQEITKANTALQTSIRNIDKGIGRAQNLVKAFGLIDDAVALSAKIASPLA